MANPSGVVRGCGTRVHGGIYAECSLSVHGSPIESFLIDPPQAIDMEAMGISKIGVKLIERAGVWHVFDYVGETHYPNVADFIEETRRFGASRRLPKNLEFNKLTPASRLLLIHGRARIVQPWFYHEARMRETCPCFVEGHDLTTTSEAWRAECNLMCAGLWWEDVENGEMRLVDSRPVVRKMPSFSYDAWRKPDGLITDYEPGIFISLPLHNIAVVRDPHDESHHNAFQCAIKSSVTVEVVDE